MQHHLSSTEGARKRHTSEFCLKNKMQTPKQEQEGALDIFLG